MKVYLVIDQNHIYMLHRTSVGATAVFPEVGDMNADIPVLHSGFQFRQSMVGHLKHQESYTGTINKVSRLYEDINIIQSQGARHKATQGGLRDYNNRKVCTPQKYLQRLRDSLWNRLDVFVGNLGSSVPTHSN